MLNPETRAALATWGEAAGALAPLLEGHAEDWTKARSDYVDAMARAFPAPDGLAVEETRIGGVPCHVVTPTEVSEGRILLYLHGGGYASGGPGGYIGLCGRYAKLLQAKVYIPDYRLAPEARFPAAIEDVFAVYRALLDDGVDPSRLTVSGDSAGGAMVVTLMRWARDAGIELPAAGVAISPWANLTHNGESCVTREGIDPLCSVYFLQLLARNFLGNALPTDPDVSPVFADVRRLSPILIQIGENEVMLSDAIRLASHLAENRVRTSLEVWPGMFHVWHLCGGILPEADAALRNAAAFLDSAMAA